LSAAAAASVGSIVIHSVQWNKVPNFITIFVVVVAAAAVVYGRWVGTY
jgi:hypothetical protein